MDFGEGDGMGSDAEDEPGSPDKLQLLSSPRRELLGMGAGAGSAAGFHLYLFGGLFAKMARRIPPSVPAFSIVTLLLLLCRVHSSSLEYGQAS